MGLFGRFKKKKSVEAAPKEDVFEKRQLPEPILKPDEQAEPPRRAPRIEPVPREVIEHREAVFRAILQHPRVIWRDDSGARKYLIVKHSDNLHHLVELSPSGFDEIRVRAMRLGPLPGKIQHAEAMKKVLEEAFHELYDAEFNYKYGEDPEKKQLAKQILDEAKTKLIESVIPIRSKSPDELQRTFYELLKSHILKN